MKPPRHKPTDDQIEADVLASLGSASAWEALPFVPASTSPRPAWMTRNKHIELAAKFHVLSILHRMGLEANLALGQPDSVDIAVLGKPGVAITIDVKAVDGSREWRVEEFSARKHHFVVVVEFSSQSEDLFAQPHTYVVASEALQKLISRRKLKAVSLEMLGEELAALEAWQLIMSEQAA
jgi:hypothetical protein